MLSVIGFAIVREASIEMESYENLFWQIFSGRALSVERPPRTASMEGFALAATQIGQFMKFDEMSETSTSHGGHISAGSVPI